MPNFANKVEQVVDEFLGEHPTDDDAFINVSRLVYDGVCDIRRMVMLNRVCIDNVGRDWNESP